MSDESQPDFTDVDNEVVRSFTRSPHKRLGDGEPRDADELVRLACLNFGADSPRRAEAALHLWRTHPALATASVFAAAAVGDHRTVADFLRRDPAAANRDGGPFEWPPLLYATYSRLVTGDQAHDFGETVRVLLRAEADANAGFLWDGCVPPFTAITGAVGRGEQAATPHRDQLEIMQLLLDAGADPNDGQLVYNAGIGNSRAADDTDWLMLLLNAGLGRESNGPWYQRFGSELYQPHELVAELVHDAARRGFVDRARLLLAHGADPDYGSIHRVIRGKSPYRDAVERGHGDIAELLTDAGANTDGVDEIDRIVGRCMSGALLTDDEATLARQRRPDLVLAAVELDKPIEVVRRLVALGWDVNIKQSRTALHIAALRGDFAAAQALVALGANPSVTDDDYQSTPAGWAAHFGHDAVRDYLSEQTSDERPG